MVHNHCVVHYIVDFIVHFIVDFIVDFIVYQRMICSSFLLLMKLFFDLCIDK